MTPLQKECRAPHQVLILFSIYLFHFSASFQINNVTGEVYLESPLDENGIYLYIITLLVDDGKFKSTVGIYYKTYIHVQKYILYI